MQKDDIITLPQGSGGKEMDRLIASFGLSFRGGWKNCDDDSAIFDMPDGTRLAFTSDSFIADPIFFPGGDIGHLAFCGTVNDLLVVGATPLGLSLSLIIEEGFAKKDLDRIISSIRSLSEKHNIPIVTGDTKVMDKGKLDKIVINTSGIGVIDKKGHGHLRKKVVSGDRIIISGGLGEHGISLLSKRFDFDTDVVTDSKPLTEEFRTVGKLIKWAKDPTRGGISAALNEISQKTGLRFCLDEKSIPVKDEVRKAAEMLGINLYDLACEGRFVCITSDKMANQVVENLRRFNPLASMIGQVEEGEGVIIRTMIGSRVLPKPTGRIVPRIC